MVEKINNTDPKLTSDKEHEEGETPRGTGIEARRRTEFHVVKILVDELGIET